LNDEPGRFDIGRLNHFPDSPSVSTRSLVRAIHASAAASVSKLLTVVGERSGMLTSTPKAPPESGTTR
jgi:hypothetical protein